MGIVDGGSSDDGTNTPDPAPMSNESTTLPSMGGGRDWHTPVHKDRKLPTVRWSFELMENVALAENRLMREGCVKMNIVIFQSAHWKVSR